MGKLLYGPSLEVLFDDRVLAHLQIAIGAKLRRRESFFLSWQDDAAHGSGRSTIWVDPAIALVFRCTGGRMPSINREWLDELVGRSNSAQGLTLTHEPNA